MVGRLPSYTPISLACLYRAQHFAALFLHQLQVHLRVVGQEGAERGGQERAVGYRGGGKPQRDAAQTGEFAQAVAQLLCFGKHRTGSLQNQAAVGCQAHAVGPADEQFQSTALLQLTQTGAGGGHRDGEGRGSLAQAAGGGDGIQQAQVDKLEVHLAFSFAEGCFRKIPILAL